jgi:hypothetical protein
MKPFRGACRMSVFSSHFVVPLAFLTFPPRNPLPLSPGSNQTTMPTLTHRRLITTRTGLNMCRGCAFKFVILLTSLVRYLFLNRSPSVHITKWFVTETGINSIYLRLMLATGFINVDQLFWLDVYTIPSHRRCAVAKVPDSVAVEDSSVILLFRRIVM